MPLSTNIWITNSCLMTCRCNPCLSYHSRDLSNNPMGIIIWNRWKPDFNEILLMEIDFNTNKVSLIPSSSKTFPIILTKGYLEMISTSGKINWQSTLSDRTRLVKTWDTTGFPGPPTLIFVLLTAQHVPKDVVLDNESIIFSYCANFCFSAQFSSINNPRNVFIKYMVQCETLFWIPIYCHLYFWSTHSRVSSPWNLFVWDCLKPDYSDGAMNCWSLCFT